MSIGSLGLYRADGRIRGTYVYLLLCRDAGPIYAKVGISDVPYRRLLVLRLGCPVKPRQFFTFEVRSRKKALKVERAIHAGLARWAAHGEWFKVEPDHKADFNAALATAIAPHRETGWPCEWSRTRVAPLIRDAHERRDAVMRLLRERSPAQVDFEKHLRQDG